MPPLPPPPCRPAYAASARGRSAVGCDRGRAAERDRIHRSDFQTAAAAAAAAEAAAAAAAAADQEIGHIRRRRRRRRSGAVSAGAAVAAAAAARGSRAAAVGAAAGKVLSTRLHRRRRRPPRHVAEMPVSAVDVDRNRGDVLMRQNGDRIRAADASAPSPSPPRLMFVNVNTAMSGPPACGVITAL